MSDVENGLIAANALFDLCKSHLKQLDQNKIVGVMAQINNWQRQYAQVSSKWVGHPYPELSLPKYKEGLQDGGSYCEPNGMPVNDFVAKISTVHKHVFDSEIVPVYRTASSKLAVLSCACGHAFLYVNPDDTFKMIESEPEADWSWCIGFVKLMNLYRNMGTLAAIRLAHTMRQDEVSHV